MSITGGLKAAPQDHPTSWLRNASTNGTQMLALLVRPARRRFRGGWRTPAWLAVIVVTSVLAIAALMTTFDADTVFIASHLPPWLQMTAARVTDFGKSSWFLVPIGGALLLIAVRASPELPRTARLLLISISVRLSFLFFAIALPSLFTTIVKRFIGRARPYVDLAGNPFHFRPFVWRSEFASLPSGHATTAVAAAVAIGLLWPQLRAPLWLYALGILASRVLLAAHYPSDVLAGAVVGAIGAYLVRDWFAERRLAFAIEPDGSVRTLAGPSFTRIKRVAHSLLAP